MWQEEPTVFIQVVCFTSQCLLFLSRRRRPGLFTVAFFVPLRSSLHFLTRIIGYSICVPRAPRRQLDFTGSAVFGPRVHLSDMWYYSVRRWVT